MAASLISPTSSAFLLFLLLLLSFRPKPCSSDPRSTEAALICSNQTAPVSQRQTFVANFLAALDSVTPQVALQGYGSSVNGTTNATIVYTYGECMKDLSLTDCNLCFAQIKTRIQKCLPFQRLTRAGRLFFDGCYLRYDEYPFYGDVVNAEDKTVCNGSDYSGNQTVFKEISLELMKNLSLVAVNNSGFADGELSRGNASVYGLVQCWEVLNMTGCNACLNDAVSRIASCSPKDEGRALNAGCYLRYSTQKFYNNSDGPPPNGTQGKGSRLAVILAATLSCAAFVALAGAAILIGRVKWARRQREKKELRALSSVANNSKLNFSYETLEEATDYFSDSNKLGQGASGSVYRGKLKDGRVVAVKRLFYNTRQWVDHFFNEINLISSIEHKNLVKLLGCSITGPESLLVYEFVPNKSLYDYLFGKDQVQKTLSWEQRYRIIVGTAEGLAYLHEESNLKIIHRDIKLGNILLDHDFTPKIADFGLVRLLPEDRSHITTAIAGTLGYMAPEYAVCGTLTEKADVYSFGVLLIEVISGKKNNTITEDSACMLHMVWSRYIQGRLQEAVDQALGIGGSFKEEDACRFLKIGLLCVQANAAVRPAMSRVVKMLTSGDYGDMVEPTQPPYLNSSSSEADITRQDTSEPLLRHSRSASSSDSVTDQSWINPR